ncbi:transcriptional repressor [Silanimonas sp.]|uniref:transcriptional repressor n=1 Tax=Silanimonas sp. TaxID=1929290 RepID=UPI0022C06A48|nr:transcriptional repressor [Silanimonas sp.]MCZ8165444.1 transcriptional repressor [Silanimonas sp.]
MATERPHAHADHVCAHPELHTHGAGEFVRAVEKACRERGLNLTPIRAEALKQIAEAGKPVKAYDLLERMRGGPGASAPPTVYRALDFLLENGFIHRLVSINAFLACHHPLAGHVVPILICKACESAQELEDETLAAQLDALARAQRFEPASSYLEVLGVCARCAGEGAA